MVFRWDPYSTEETRFSVYDNPNELVVVYVLGGPGSGKTSTHCSKISSLFGFHHLSVDELLQTEVCSGLIEYKVEIEACWREGKPIPTGLVVDLLKQAMAREETKRFLIEGFPRNQDDADAAARILNIQPKFVLFVDCQEGLMTRRFPTMNRNLHGRADCYNMENMMERDDHTGSVIDYYRRSGKVINVGEKPQEFPNGQKPENGVNGKDVYEEIEAIFSWFRSLDIV